MSQLQRGIVLTAVVGGVISLLITSAAHADLVTDLAGCTSFKEADDRLVCFDKAVEMSPAVAVAKRNKIVYGGLIPDLAACTIFNETDKRLSCFDKAVENVPAIDAWKIEAAREREAEAKRKEAEAAVQAECTRRGQPKIGMTEEELIASCWGRPLRIVKKTTAGGVEESYIYNIGRIVLFSNGKIIEITEAR